MGSSCKCVAINACAWSKATREQLEELRKSNVTIRSLPEFRQLKAQICNKKKKQVWCCRDGEAATESELPFLSGIKLEYF